MKFGTKELVLSEIKALAENNEVHYVKLFGSRARGDYYQTSDIDMAVAGGDTISFSLAVEEETSKLLKFDVVNLDASVQPEQKDAIQKEGIIIYERHPIKQRMI